MIGKKIHYFVAKRFDLNTNSISYLTHLHNEEVYDSTWKPKSLLKENSPHLEEFDSLWEKIITSKISLDHHGSNPAAAGDSSDHHNNTGEDPDPRRIPESSDGIPIGPPLAMTTTTSTAAGASGRNSDRTSVERFPIGTKVWVRWSECKHQVLCMCEFSWWPAQIIRITYHSGKNSGGKNLRKNHCLKRYLVHFFGDETFLEIPENSKINLLKKFDGKESKYKTNKKSLQKATHLIPLDSPKKIIVK